MEVPGLAEVPFLGCHRLSCVNGVIVDGAGVRASQPASWACMFNSSCKQAEIACQIVAAGATA